MTVPQNLTILHLDMDAFYASVEIRDNPSLAQRPVIVGGTSARGVVSAASYLARRAGVHSAMPIFSAKKLCPTGIFLTPRMSRYIEVSRQIMAIFHRFTPLVEPLSLDEAFLDVEHSSQLFGTASKIAQEIRKTVKEETKLTVSAGVATSKLVAKIASDQNKPDGLTIVPAGTEKQFLAPLPIKRLWGVGKRTKHKLSMMGIATIGDLSKLDASILTSKFGQKQGYHLYQTSNAIDTRKVTPIHDTQSFGNEYTLDKDILDLPLLKRNLLALTVRVCERLRKAHLRGRTVTVKIKYYDFQQQTCSVTMSTPTANDKEVYRHGLKLLEKTKAGTKAVRLVGLSLSQLIQETEPTQTSLLFHQETGKDEQLWQAIDAINQKFADRTNMARNQASKAIAPGRLFENGNQQKE